MRRLLATSTTMLLVLVGCSSPASQPSDTLAVASNSPQGESEDTQADRKSSRSGGGEIASDSPGEIAQPTAPLSQPELSKPPKLDFPYKTKLDVKATLSPTCVNPGGTVTLDVQTEPVAAIAYQAIYSNGMAGSKPPMGEGYGGNDKGYSTKTGSYVSAWAVSLDAPRGPARADVFVGFEGKWGYADPHFAVAYRDGSCPEKWLRKGKGQ